MELHIPDDLADALRRRAAACGSDPKDLAMEAIRRILLPTEPGAQPASPLDVLAGSGLSEDEAVDLFEEEKHLMRRENNANNS